MIGINSKMAIASLKSARARSALTILGIVIGIASIMTIIALSNGIKHDTHLQLDDKDDRLLIARPGNNPLTISPSQFLRGQSASAPSTLTQQDIDTVSKLSAVDSLTYALTIGGLVSIDEQHAYPDATILAVPDNYLKTMHISLARGSFFEADELSQNSAIIGQNVAQDLLGDDAPIGRVIRLRGNEFVVRGVFAKVPDATITPEPSMNDLVVIPIESGHHISPQATLSSVYIRLRKDVLIDESLQTITKIIRTNHGGDNDFYIQKSSQQLAGTMRWLSAVSYTVTAIAGLSLFVGGIGIMNIMLVSVSERTKEIGIRKAVGATNRQIMSQFLIESTLLSLFGGIIGLATALLLCLLLRLTTGLEPALTVLSGVQAIGLATVVGIAFGTTPAIQAARKDPIIALRHD